jgi:hypothetical protein
MGIEKTKSRRNIRVAALRGRFRGVRHQAALKGAFMDLKSKSFDIKAFYSLGG